MKDFFKDVFMAVASAALLIYLPVAGYIIGGAIGAVGFFAGAALTLVGALVIYEGD